MDRTADLPLWRILDHQGRTLAWLARVTEYSESRIWAMKGGRAAPSLTFRERAAKALDLPEFVLFDGEGQPDQDSVDASAGLAAV